MKVYTSVAMASGVNWVSVRHGQGYTVLIFCVTPSLTPGLENVGLRIPTLTTALKNLDFDSRT